MTKKITRDDFETWLFHMDAELDAFMRELPPSSAQNLDYSIESIPIFEKMVLKKFSSITEAISPENKILFDRLSRYLGQTIQKTLEGKWDIELNDSKDAYYQLPVIATPTGIKCPATMITATIDRNTGKFLEKVLRATQRRQQVK